MNTYIAHNVEIVSLLTEMHDKSTGWGKLMLARQRPFLSEWSTTNGKPSPNDEAKYIDCGHENTLFLKTIAQQYRTISIVHDAHNNSFFFHIAWERSFYCASRWKQKQEEAHRHIVIVYKVGNMCPSSMLIL